MTQKNNTAPKSLEETHASRISRDELLYELAETCVYSGITPMRALSEKFQEAMKSDDFVFYLSGSSFTAASANPLHFAMQKIAKVAYGLNHRLLIGSAYHKGVEFGYNRKRIDGELPRLGLCVREIVSYIHKEYEKMNADEKQEYTKTDLIKEATRLLKVYYKGPMQDNVPYLVEAFTCMQVPEYMLANPERNAKKIFLTGAADVIFDTENGMVLSDNKTSAKRISGKVDMDEKLTEYLSERTEKERELKALQKQIEKFAHAAEKLAELVKDHTAVSAQLDEVLAYNAANPDKKPKAHKALTNKVERLLGEVEKWEGHERTLAENKAKAEELEHDLEDLETLIEPLQKVYDEAKAQADLAEAKKMHGQQLAFYALLIMITYKVKIDRVRIENMVKSKTPELQVFEWELDQYTLQIAEEEIRSNIALVEMVLNGVDPMVIFRQNVTSYIGSETNEFVFELEEAVRLKLEEQQGDMTAMAA